MSSETLALIDDVKEKLGRLLHRPDLDVRDRQQVFLMLDILKNLSVCHARRDVAFDELIADFAEMLERHGLPGIEVKERQND